MARFGFARRPGKSAFLGPTSFSVIYLKLNPQVMHATSLPPRRFRQRYWEFQSRPQLRGQLHRRRALSKIDNRPQLQRARHPHTTLRGGCGGVSSGPPKACVIVIVISTDLRGPLISLVLAVIRTCGLSLGNELITCSILVLSRFRLYDTTFFLLSVRR